MAVHATDYYDAIYVVRVPNSKWSVVFDAELQPLQFVGAGMVLSARRNAPWRYIANRLVQRWVLRRHLEPARQLLQASLSNNGELISGNGVPAQVRRVPLFHPDCVAAARHDPRFTLGRHDLFAPSPRTYHVIRVMNVLTPEHLPEDLLRRAVCACATGLREGGLFVAGRTVDEEELAHGSHGLRVCEGATVGGVGYM